MNAVLQVANLIGADAKEIIFTSGATESNNLAIKGVANFYREKKKHIITTQTDRKSLPLLQAVSMYCKKQLEQSISNCCARHGVFGSLQCLSDS